MRQRTRYAPAHGLIALSSLALLLMSGVQFLPTNTTQLTTEAAASVGLQPMVRAEQLQQSALEKREAQLAAEKQAAAEAEVARRRAAVKPSRSAVKPRPATTAPSPAPRVARPAPEPGSNRAIGTQLAAERGWTGAQWDCLDSLWTKESGWNQYAGNRSSGAYGIPQALPGSKMATAGADWQTNPATQIRWGLSYIASRYGTPCAAWSHFRARNWY